MTNIGNDYLVEENIEKIDKVLDENYIKEVNLNEGIKELSYLKDKLKKHKFDYIFYYYKEYLAEAKENKKIIMSDIFSDDDTGFVVFVTLLVIGLIGVVSFLVWREFIKISFFTKLTAIIPTAIVMGMILTIPTHIFSMVRSFRKYGDITDTIKDKLALLTERKEDLTKELAKKSSKIKSIDKVDSFIKLIVSYKEDLDTLSEEDSKRIKIELVKLGKEYMEYAVKGPKEGLAIDETMLEFNKRLANIELEIERLKQNTTKNTANEVALEEAFGLDITELDTSSVKLNPSLNGPTLERKLKK